MSSCAPSPLEPFARCLVSGLRRELLLTPKPGLVDGIDRGSHPDLCLATMNSSIDLIASYLAETLEALAAGKPLEALVAIGRRAEERMLRAFGTNTHKGAIFLTGLLLAARFRISSDGESPLSDSVAVLSARLFRSRLPADTHGGRLRETLGAGGIVAEAKAGLPTLFGIALPAYREGLNLGGAPQTASFFMMARLMQTVEDTTALHRCGQTGLARLRRDGQTLEALLLAGADPRPLLGRLNNEYRAMRLTMGGVADLLGLAFGYLEYCGELEQDTHLGLTAPKAMASASVNPG